MLFVTVINRHSVIFRLKEPLTEMVDPDFLLPAKLFHLKFLSDSERQIVKSKGSLQERNDALLNFVLKVLQQGDDTELLRFTAALRETDQEHVYNFIKCNGSK